MLTKFGRTIKATTLIIWERLPRIALYTFAFYLIFTVGNEIGNKYLPGEFFLASKNVRVQDIDAGNNIPFEWCRAPRFGNIKAHITRSFYKYDNEADHFTAAGEYEFDTTIEMIDSECLPLIITAGKYPDEEGTYFFVSDVDWKQGGYPKHLRYRLNNYNVNATPESILKRIQALKDEITRLNSLLDRLREKVPADSTSPLSSTTPATPQQSPNTSNSQTPQQSSGSGSDDGNQSTPGNSGGSNNGGSNGNSGNNEDPECVLTIPILGTQVICRT